MQQQRNSHQHVSNIAKHDSNEEPKGDYVERSGIYLRVRGHSVSIDDSLGDLQHHIAVEFAWRHLLALLYVEDQRRHMRLWLDYQW